MEVVAQKDNVSVVPQLFWDGGTRLAILMRQAYIDLNYCWCLEHVESLFGIPAAGLMARIQRYTEGRMLTSPEEINYEQDPFLAIKFAYCDDWDAFRARKGNVKDLTHLRAYFWDESKSNEQLMCITHFKIKTKAKLDPEDTRTSKIEKDYFLGTDCFYCDENWS